MIPATAESDRYWAVMWVDKIREENWRLLDQSISLQIIKTIETAEDVYGINWGGLQKRGFYLVRLRLMPDGQPGDIAFAWTERPKPIAAGVMSYHEYAEQCKRKVTETVSSVV